MNKEVQINIIKVGKTQTKQGNTDQRRSEIQIRGSEI